MTKDQAEAKARSIVDDCTSVDSDTSYGFALTCDQKFLIDKITSALMEASPKMPSEDSLFQAAIDHADSIHSSRGPLPVLDAKDLEDLFEAGARWAIERMRE